MNLMETQIVEMFSIGRLDGSDDSEDKGSNDQDAEYRDGEDEPKTQG